MNITIYSKSNCPNCMTAKALLQSKKLEYTEYSADSQAVLAALIEKHPAARQMPQCFISGQRVGGLAGLQAALKEMGI